MEGDGYFIEPTVFSNVTDDMRIAKEEVRTLHAEKNCQYDSILFFVVDFRAGTVDPQVQDDGGGTGASQQDALRSRRCRHHQ